ncbi:hypothetical protein RNJ44_04595 [Nakaseomyces bracarensis]|uniref:N-acetyltransferase domain-containing protein n=1 Tax=Nakaseomyces bracarensis TaxID=273131 RepID=A0ABR4NVD2_9SACH
MGRDIINLDNVYENNLGMMAKIAKVVYPEVQFEDKFFSELFPGKNDKRKDVLMAQIAYYSEIPVATVKLMILQKKKSDTLNKGVHILIMAVLEQYRGHGIEEKLVQYAVDQCKKSHQHKLFVHVPVKDQTTIEWYTNQGFHPAETKGEPVNLKTGETEETIALLKEVA